MENGLTTWREGESHCLDCGQQHVNVSLTGRCQECGGLLLRKAVRIHRPHNGDLFEKRDSSGLATDDSPHREAVLGKLAEQLYYAQAHVSEEVPALLLKMAELFGELGSPARRQAYAERALAIFRERGDRVREARALCVLADVDRERGEIQVALRWCKQALRVIGQDGDPLEVARIKSIIAELFESVGSYAQAMAIHREVVTRAREGGARAASIVKLGRCLIALGEYQTAFDYFEDALAQTDSPSPGEVVSVALAQALLYLTIHDPKTARSCVEWASTRLTDSDSHSATEALLLMGRVYLQEGDPPRAEEVLAQAEELARKHHRKTSIPGILHARGLTAMARGNSKEARNLANQAFELAETHGLRETAVLAAVLFCEIDRYQSPDGALEEVVEKIHAYAKGLRLPELVWRTSLLVARVKERVGDVNGERRYLQQTLELLSDLREKYREFGRVDCFFRDHSKLKAYGDWARRMVDWGYRQDVEATAGESEDPALVQELGQVLFQ